MDMIDHGGHGYYCPDDHCYKFVMWAAYIWGHRSVVGSGATAERAERDAEMRWKHSE